MVSENGPEENGPPRPAGTKSRGGGAAAQESDSEKVLLFVVQELLFCVDLFRVTKMLPLATLRPVPLGPPYLVGLLDLGGKSIPVIDLGTRLGLRNGRRYRLDTPILLMTDGKKAAGLIVSDAIGVAEVKGHGTQLDTMFKQGHAMFQGVVNTDQGQALLLDLGRVLAIDFSGEIGEAGIDAALAGGGSRG